MTKQEIYKELTEVLEGFENMELNEDSLYEMLLKVQENWGTITRKKETRVLPTRRLIESLAKEYLEHENYTMGIISGYWVGRVSKELNLENLSDLELSNMWDMVYLTLDCEFNYYDKNKDYETADKYRDVQSAFTEVVNREARIRRMRRD